MQLNKDFFLSDSTIEKSSNFDRIWNKCHKAIKDIIFSDQHQWDEFINEHRRDSLHILAEIVAKVKVGAHMKQ